jgi:hypothetical protein
VKILVLVLQSTSLLAKRTCCNVVVVVECESTRAVISPTHTSSSPVGLGRKAWKLNCGKLITTLVPKSRGYVARCLNSVKSCVGR